MHFPLAERELARSGKRKRTYLLRMIALGATCPVVFIFWMGALMRAMAPFNPSTSVGEEVGRFLAHVSTAFQLGVLFLVAPLLCAGQIAREKEEQTLQLLVLADFRGWDIFLAKFFGPFLQAELLVLSTLPLMAFAAFTGGISVPATAAQVALISLWLCAVCALGLLFSTLAKRPVDALFWTVSTLILWTVGAGCLDHLPAGPAGTSATLNMGTAALSADEPNIGRFYWMPAVLLTCGLGVAASGLTIWLLPKQIFERARRRARARRPRPRRRWLRIPPSPAAKLIAASARGLSGSLRFTALKLVVAAGLAALSLFVCFGGWLLIVVLFLYDVTATMASARTSGALDDVRVTPIQDVMLTRAILRAFASKTWIYIPGLALAPAPFFYGFPPLSMAIAEAGANASLLEGLIALTIVLAALFVYGTASFLLLLNLGCFATTLPGGPVKQTLAGVLIAVPIAAALSVASWIAGGVAAMFFAVFWHGALDAPAEAAVAVAATVAFWTARVVPYAFLAYALYRSFVARCRGALTIE